MESKIGLQRWYADQCITMGTAFLGAGVLYLLAANWFLWPSLVKLLIPQVLLLICALLTSLWGVDSHKGHCSAALAGVMIGLSLASYGQVYQTGADSYLLFVTWSLLLLPWLIFCRSALWVLFYVTSFCALFLAQSQLELFSEEVFPLIVTIFFLSLTALSQFCPSSQKVLLLIIVVVSLIYTLIYSVQWNNWNFSVLLISSALPIAVALFFYKQRQTTLAGIALFSFALNCAFWMIVLVMLHIDALLAFPLLVVLLVLWCWQVGKLFNRFSKKIVIKSRLFLYLGLLFGVVMSVATIAVYLVAYGFLKVILFDNMTASLGVLTIGALLVVTNKNSVFLRRLGLVVILIGEILLYIYLIAQLFDNYFAAGVIKMSWVLLSIQLLFIVVSWNMSKTVIWHVVQIALFVLLFYGAIFIETGRLVSREWLMSIPLLIFAINPQFFAEEKLRRTLFFWTLFTFVLFWIIGVAFYYSFTESGYTLGDLPSWLYTLIYLSSWIAPLLMLVVVCVRLQLQMLSLFGLVALLTFGILSYFQLATLTILFLLLLILGRYQDRTLHFMTLLMIALEFSRFYYSLQMPFLYKAAAILSSGILIYIMGILLKKENLSKVEAA